MYLWFYRIEWFLNLYFLITFWLYAIHRFVTLLLREENISFWKKFWHFAGIFPQSNQQESNRCYAATPDERGFEHGPKIERAPERRTGHGSGEFNFCRYFSLARTLSFGFLETTGNSTSVFISPSGRVCPIADSVVVGVAARPTGV